MITLKKILKTAAFVFAFLAGILSWGSGFINIAQAASVVVEPMVIDHQGLPRDIIKGSFKISNPNPHKVSVFTTTKNFDPSSGAQEFVEPGVADLSNSLANWISVGNKLLELEPGETKEVPYEIEINLRAQEGVYHAIMYFPVGSTRAESEQFINSAPKISVNVTVGSNSKERLKVAQFQGPGMSFGFSSKFQVEVNNTGNTSLKPKGEVRIYNRNGEEVATIPINNQEQEVAPDQSQIFKGVWTKAHGFGRYKAQIVLEFGDKQFQTYQDSVFFWLLPWPILLFLIMILCGTALLLVYTLHSAHTKRMRAQEEYYQKMMKQKLQQAKRAAVKKVQSTENKSESKTKNQNE